MKELKRFQTIRRVEWQEAVKQKNKSFYKDPFLAEAATRFSSGEQHSDLKKQSQFAMNDIGASLYAQDGYGDNPDGGIKENKANQACPEQRRTDQFDTSEPVRGENAPALRACK
jgi:hypothetical protein